MCVHWCVNICKFSKLKVRPEHRWGVKVSLSRVTKFRCLYHLTPLHIIGRGLVLCYLTLELFKKLNTLISSRCIIQIFRGLFSDWWCYSERRYRVVSLYFHEKVCLALIILLSSTLLPKNIKVIDEQLVRKTVCKEGFSGIINGFPLVLFSLGIVLVLLKQSEAHKKVTHYGVFIISQLHVGKRLSAIKAFIRGWYEMPVFLAA